MELYTKWGSRHLAAVWPPLLNPGFVKARPTHTLLHLPRCQELAGPSRGHGQSHHCGEVLRSWVLVTEGREEGASNNKRKLISPLVLDLVSYGHDVDVNHAGKTHEMSSLISSVVKYLKLGTSASAPRNVSRENFPQDQSCKLLR